jgi:hypothetical protein
MKFRITNATCQNCKQSKLEAVEFENGNVSDYRCSGCGAVFDADVWHDFKNKRHWWIGRLRNPEFWRTDKEGIDFVEGVMIMNEKIKKGITEHLGVYVIEEIKQR